jgi:hypothetical protein
MPYFDRVQRFCFFIAPGRSGHSIVGHLLTAHPEVLISDELNALEFLRRGFSASQVYGMIYFRNSRSEGRGRPKSGYDYRVKGTAQGDLDKHPLVIGDAKGSATSKLLADDESLVDRVRAAVGVPLRVFVQVRHPFDILATKLRRKECDLPSGVNQIKKIAEAMEKAAAQLDDDEKLFQTHEELIADPKAQFEKLFRFIDVEPLPEIVDACAGRIWEKPHQTRKSISWQDGEEERLVEAMRNSAFFARYFSE